MKECYVTLLLVAADIWPAAIQIFVRLDLIHALSICHIDIAYQNGVCDWLADATSIKT